MYVDTVVAIGLAIMFVLLVIMFVLSEAKAARLRGKLLAAQEELQVDGRSRRLGSLMLARTGRAMAKIREDQAVVDIDSDNCLVMAAAVILLRQEEIEAAEQQEVPRGR